MSSGKVQQQELTFCIPWNTSLRCESRDLRGLAASAPVRISVAVGAHGTSVCVRRDPVASTAIAHLVFARANNARTGAVAAAVDSSDPVAHLERLVVEFVGETRSRSKRVLYQKEDCEWLNELND